MSTELDFDVFFAVLEKKEKGGIEKDWSDPYRKRYYDDEDDEEDDYGGDSDASWHELDDIIESSVTIKKLVDLDGRLLRSKMDVGEEDIEKI